MFNPDFRRLDGTHGYTSDELKNLTKAHKASFEKFEEQVVEQATAAPGEKRTTATKAKKKPAKK